MPLAWLASYPKSGNTWVRLMLLSYLEDEPLDMNRKHDWHGDWSRSSVVADLGEMLNEGVSWSPRQEGLVTLKTHFLPGVEVHRPYREAAGKVLYIVRNPRDVLHSAERHLGVSPRHRTAFARHFIAHRGFEGWRRLGWGSWVENAAEWMSPERHFPNADVRVVRYEDMRSDPAGSLAGIVRFLELDDHVDGDRIERAVRNSALDRLREQERRTSAPQQRQNPFFGPGLCGQSLRDYGEDVEERYRHLLDSDTTFAELANRWGYAA